MMEQFGSLNIAKLTYKFDDYFYGNHFINNHNIFIWMKAGTISFINGMNII